VEFESHPSLYERVRLTRHPLSMAAEHAETPRWHSPEGHIVTQDVVKEHTPGKLVYGTHSSRSCCQCRSFGMDELSLAFSISVRPVLGILRHSRYRSWLYCAIIATQTNFRLVTNEGAQHNTICTASHCFVCSTTIPKCRSSRPLLFLPPDQRLNEYLSM
jgi:hypothetical protein